MIKVHGIQYDECGDFNALVFIRSRSLLFVISGIFVLISLTGYNIL